MMFIASIIVAQSGISLKEIGLYESLLFVAGISSFFYTGAFTTRLLSSGQENRKTDYQTVFFILLLSSVLISFLLFAFKVKIANQLKIVDPEWISLFAIYVSISTPGYLLEYILLLEKKLKLLIGYGLIYAVLYIALATILLFCGYGIKSLIIAIISLAGIRLLWLVFWITNQYGLKLNLFELKKYLTEAMPLMISLLLSGSASYVDSFLVANNFGQADLAIFRYGAKELPLSLLLATGLSNAMVPALSQSLNFSEHIILLKRKTTGLMHLVFPVSILLMLTAHWLFPLFFTDKFNGSILIFKIYLLLVCSRVLFPQTILLAKGYYKKIAVTSALELCINIIASLILMRVYGLAGIAMGTIIAFALEKAILFYHLKKLTGINPNEIINLRILITYCLILSIACFISILA